MSLKLLKFDRSGKIKYKMLLQYSRSKVPGRVLSTITRMGNNWHHYSFLLICQDIRAGCVLCQPQGILSLLHFFFGMDTHTNSQRRTLWRRKADTR